MAGTGTILGPIWPLSLLGDTWAWLAVKHFWYQEGANCEPSEQFRPLTPSPTSFLFYYIPFLHTAWGDNWPNSIKPYYASLKQSVNDPQADRPQLPRRFRTHLSGAVRLSHGELHCGL